MTAVGTPYAFGVCDGWADKNARSGRDGYLRGDVRWRRGADGVARPAARAGRGCACRAVGHDGVSARHDGSPVAALLPAGRLGDVLGRDRVWRAGLVGFALSSAACAVVPGLGWLVAARAVQGLGAALITANAAPLLVEAFPQGRGRALGLGNVAIALGIVAGPPVGALLAHLAS